MTTERIIQIHEKGHEVVAEALGLDVTRTGVDNVAIKFPKTMRQRDYENKIMVCYAGYLAEKLYGEPTNGFIRGKRSDYDVAKKLIREYTILYMDGSLSGVGNDKLIQKISKTLENKTVDILKVHRDDFKPFSS